MTVEVTDVRPSSPFDTVITFEGRDTEDGSEIIFAADQRPALDICAALNAGEVVYAEIEEWAVLGRIAS